MFALAQTPLFNPLIRVDIPSIFKNRSFLPQKVRTSASEELPCLQNVRTGQAPPPDCGRLYGQSVTCQRTSAQKRTRRLFDFQSIQSRNSFNNYGFV